MQGLFRVEQVLQGDSAEVVIDGVDADDRRVRIEMPRAEAAEIRSGSVLVVQWWVAELPVMGAGTPSGADRPETEPVAEFSVAESESDRAQGERADQEFRALLGLD